MPPIFLRCIHTTILMTYGIYHQSIRGSTKYEFSLQSALDARQCTVLFAENARQIYNGRTNLYFHNTVCTVKYCSLFKCVICRRFNLYNRKLLNIRHKRVGIKRVTRVYAHTHSSLFVLPTRCNLCSLYRYLISINMFTQTQNYFQFSAKYLFLQQKYKGDLHSGNRIPQSFFVLPKNATK